VLSREPRAATLQITVLALSLVLGLSGAALLPLLMRWTGEALLVSLAFALASLPFVGLWVVGRKPAAETARKARSWLFATGVPVVCAMLVLPLFNLYHGQVRVLNHGDEAFWFWVDGKRVTRVEPSSGESALAGVELWVPAGLRELVVTRTSDGRELFRARELVESGSPHLFAPESQGYCFSIEQRAYGDAAQVPVESQPLEGPSPFWVLPDGISWFTPNPEPGLFPTSGGTIACLRQKRCQN
jgi:hypothetical protein